MNGCSAVSLGSLQPFPSSSTVGCAEIPGPNHKEVLDGSAFLRQRTGFRLSSETRIPARKTDRSYRDSCCKKLSSRTARTKETFTTGHACRGILCGSDWLRLRGISETECMIARCFSSVQCVRTAQSKGALLGLSVLVGPSASRRIPLAVRSNALLWGLRQNRQPLLWAHRQYLRLRARPLEVGFGCGWRLLPSSPRPRTSASGTIPATASSPRADPRSLPVRSSPLHSRKSAHQNRLALPQEGRTHQATVNC